MSRRSVSGQEELLEARRRGLTRASGAWHWEGVQVEVWDIPGVFMESVNSVTKGSCALGLLDRDLRETSLGSSIDGLLQKRCFCYM